MGYKIPDVKTDIKNNISDFIYQEWYNEGEHPDTEAEAEELVAEINAIVKNTLKNRTMKTDPNNPRPHDIQLIAQRPRKRSRDYKQSLWSLLHMATYPNDPMEMAVQVAMDDWDLDDTAKAMLKKMII